MQPNYKIRQRFSYLDRMPSDQKRYLEKELRQELFEKAYDDGYTCNGYYIFRDEINWRHLEDGYDVLEINLFIEHITPDNFKYLFEEALDYFNSPEYYKYQRMEHDIRRT